MKLGNSNTTLVKVKFLKMNIILVLVSDSNTTLVKVKCEDLIEKVKNHIFKYNSC